MQDSHWIEHSQECQSIKPELTGRCWICLDPMGSQEHEDWGDNVCLATAQKVVSLYHGAMWWCEIQPVQVPGAWGLGQGTCQKLEKRGQDRAGL